MKGIIKLAIQGELGLQIELLLIKHDLNHLIILAFENNQHSIIIKLNSFINCREIINNYYNENFNKTIGLDKIYKDLIKKNKIVNI